MKAVDFDVCKKPQKLLGYHIIIIIIIMKFISDRMSIEKQYKAVTRNTNTQRTHTHTKISIKTAEMLNYSIYRYGAVVFK